MTENFVADGSVSRRTALALFGGVGAGLAAALGGVQAAPFDQIERLPDGLRLSQGRWRIDLRCQADQCLSVIKYSAESALDRDGFFLSDRPAPMSLQVGEDFLRCGAFELRVDRAQGTLTVRREDKILLQDLGDPQHGVFRQGLPSDLFGLGQFRDSIANYRGGSVYLAHANMDAVNPVLVSPQGWGLLWDTGTDSLFSNDGDQLRFTHWAPLTRYHLLLGEGCGGVVAAYRRLTGRAPMLAKFAYGFWQSQERYHSQDEVLGMVAGYRERQLPLDVVVQDWRYWGEDGQFSGMVWDKVAFPDPTAMCTAIHQKDAHILASVWPAFGPESGIFQALAAEGLLFPGAHWGGGKVLDMTAPRAREIYWQHINAGLMAVGLDGLWTDGCEPEFRSTGNRYVTVQSYAENGECAAGPIKDHLLTFSFFQTRLIYQSMRRDHPDKRPLTLSRKVYAGQQAFNAVTWSGDQFSGWQTLRDQIVAAQQISMTGLPYWTDDIGGFLVTHRFPKGLADPAFRELYVRWFQFGAFMPIFRAHGTEMPRHLWAFGEAGDPCYEAMRLALERRYALLPYIYAQAARVTFEDESFLRPLVMDFAHDSQCQGYPHQYLFGHDLLVAVVDRPLQSRPDDLFTFVPNMAIGGESGPAAEVAFFEGTDFRHHVETRHSDDLKMSWTGDLPLPLVGKPYSARWRGTITAQESGLHHLRVTAQGGVRFTLGGQLRIAVEAQGGRVNSANGGVSFAGHAGDHRHEFVVPLRAGLAVPFELIQTQPVADVVSLWVEWSPPRYRDSLQPTAQTSISVYLPTGSDWYRWDGGPRLAGGQVLTLRPTLSEMPLFIRAGAVLPRRQGLQFASGDLSPDRIDLYAGADGATTLYDDDGNGHRYEQGHFRRWPLRWEDRTRTLTFAPAEGDFARDRPLTLSIVLHGIDGQEHRQVVTVRPDAMQTIQCGE